MASNDHTTSGNGTGDKGSTRSNLVYGRHNAEQMSFRDILGKLYPHKAVITITFVIVVVATVLYTFSRKPVYEASSEILLTKNVGGSQAKMDGLNDFIQPLGSDQRRIADELAILQTELLRDRVAQYLLENPIMKTDGRGDTLGIVLPSAAGNSRDIGPFATLGEVAARLSGTVKFANRENSDIIDISVRSHHPQEAAFIANVYAREYYNLNLSSSRAIARNMRIFLKNQLSDAQTALASAEDSLRDYMQSQRIVSLDRESSALINVMSTMEAQRDDVVVEMKTDENVLGIYRGQLEKAESTFSSHMSDALDPYIALLQQQIAQLQVNRDVAIAQNPPVVNRSVYNQAVAQADSQIASLKRKLKTKTTEFLKSQVIAGVPSRQGQDGGNASGFDPMVYYTDLRLKVLQTEVKLSSDRAQKQALDRILDQYERKFSRIPRQYISLAQLERTQQSRSKLFLMIQDNFQQARIAEQSHFGNVQIIDLAKSPAGPVSPRVPYNLTVGILLGLALGVGLAFLIDRLEGAIRSPEDLEKKGFKILSVIPVIPHANAVRRKSGIEKTVVVTGRKIPLRLVTLHSPADPASEAYLSLRTVIQYSMIVRKIQSLLVVSALPREGKSTTVVNLSVALANAGLKTLMLDADLRGPTLHRLWNVERNLGLTDYLKGKIELNAAVKKTNVQNLFLLPTGPLPRNPSEILGSDAMKATMEIVKASFDIVLIDSPPVLAVTDAAVLSQLSDAVLFITSAKRTKLDLVDKSSEDLRRVEANVIGYVLNQFDYQKAYGTYHNYKYYSQYYRKKEADKENR